MKIRKPETVELQNKINGLLLRTFHHSKKQQKLVEALRYNKREIYEWVALHRNMAIGYLLFTRAYTEKKIIGLHLSLIAVQPDFQNQGIGTELMQYAIRQKEIRDKMIFTNGPSFFFEKFGFKKSTDNLISSTNKPKALLVRNELKQGRFAVGYEKECSF